MVGCCASGNEEPREAQSDPGSALGVAPGTCSVRFSAWRTCLSHSNRSPHLDSGLSALVPSSNPVRRFSDSSYRLPTFHPDRRCGYRVRRSPSAHCIRDDSVSRNCSCQPGSPSSASVRHGCSYPWLALSRSGHHGCDLAKPHRHLVTIPRRRTQVGRSEGNARDCVTCALT